MSIIKMQKLVAGWEAIPNSFANDVRLSSDAVAVGLWLATKPTGWQVRPAAIQSEFSRRPGKLRGREWWSRVSSELKDAGYLRLNSGKDSKGQFSSSWDFCIAGLSMSSSNVLSVDNGSAAHGLSDTGSPHHSNHHPLDSSLKTTTTHKQAGTPVKPSVCVEVDAMLTEAQLSAGMKKLIEKELAVLDQQLQIAVVREFIAHRSGIRHPVPWMRRVCADTLCAGEFVPAKQPQPVQQINVAPPANRTCEIDGCSKYAATNTSRGWRCVNHIGK